MREDRCVQILHVTRKATDRATAPATAPLGKDTLLGQRGAEDQGWPLARGSSLSPSDRPRRTWSRLRRPRQTTKPSDRGQGPGHPRPGPREYGGCYPPGTRSDPQRLLALTSPVLVLGDVVVFVPQMVRAHMLPHLPGHGAPHSAQHTPQPAHAGAQLKDLRQFSGQETPPTRSPAPGSGSRSRASQ